MDIQEWLQNKGDYNTGLQLYIASGKANNNLVRLFSKKQTPANFSKLKYELKKLVKKKVVVNHVVDANKTIVPAKKEITVIPSKPNQETTASPYKNLQLHEIPLELRPVYQKQKQLFTKVCFLHADLSDLHPEQNGLDLCLQIESTWDEIALLWQKLDFYRDHKIILQSKPTDFSHLSPAQLLQKRNNVRSNITKHTKQLEKMEETPPNTTLLSVKKKYESKIRKKQETILDNQTLEIELSKLIDKKA